MKRQIVHFFSHIEAAQSQITIVKDFLSLITRKDAYFDLNNHIFFIITNEQMYSIASKAISFSELNIHFLLGEEEFLSSYQEIREYANLIIFHQFPFYEKLLNFLKEELDEITRKIMWYIWGGDLYFFQQMNQFKNNNVPLIEQLRKEIIPRFGYIGCWNRHDFDVLKAHYGTQGEFFQAYYSTDIDLKKIIQTISYSTYKKNILIGNSGNPSNNHIQLIESISHLKKHNIHLYLIFSYGGEKIYYKNVKETLNQYFKGKYTIIYEFMDYIKYTTFLNQIDVCIMHQERQQGAGLLLWLFLLKKKIYLNKKSSTYIHFTELGCCLFQSSALQKATFEELFQYDTELLEGNRDIILNEYDEAKLISHWKKIFDRSQSSQTHLV